MPGPTHLVPSDARSGASAPALREGSLGESLVLFFAVPVIFVAYYTAVTVLKLVQRGSA